MCRKSLPPWNLTLTSFRRASEFGIKSRYVLAKDLLRSAVVEIVARMRQVAVSFKRLTGVFNNEALFLSKMFSPHCSDWCGSRRYDSRYYYFRERSGSRWWL